ncbi:hypothetical protein K435DRAFT_792483 [Dendrothele bispora CBS 962.96]|uniref:Uncharacterized protein n=1 Tax=Dendrothele bispora (strain CBS 962.96) TaxID=1314807 RepID=A0A4S8MIS8_DENBC|nr:hypothetical protein K435DRAFT_792483 [Dendrothele bispora CBS 962.96]
MDAVVDVNTARHGLMFAGLVINILLYGSLIFQFYLYFVAFLFVAETASVVLPSVFLYDSIIIHFAPAVGGIVSGSTEIFFGWRIKNLGKPTQWMALPIFGLALAHIVKDESERLYDSHVPGLMRSSTTSRGFLGTKNDFAERGEPTNLVDRLVADIFQTGLLTAFVSTTNLVTYASAHWMISVPLKPSLFKSSSPGWCYEEDWPEIQRTEVFIQSEVDSDALSNVTTLAGPRPSGDSGGSSFTTATFRTV